MSLATAPIEFAPLRHAEVKRLEARLQHQLRSRIGNLELILSSSGLTLRGLADSYYVKQLIQHAVMQAIDLPLYANQIEVQPASGRGVAIAVEPPEA